MLNEFEVIKHHFINDELYLKEMLIHDGAQVVSHKHKFDHASFLVKGCCIVEADGVQTTHYAPDTIIIKAGVNHSVVAVNGDVKWYCAHVTNETDETKVDEVLIA
ncbi:MAG: hypothetical protein WC009_13945 [Methylotenera sp.]